MKEHLGQTYNSIFFSERNLLSTSLEVRQIYSLFLSSFAVVEINGFAVLDEIREVCNLRCQDSFCFVYNRC